jgi:hypothetical protein
MTGLAVKRLKMAKPVPVPERPTHESCNSDIPKNTPPDRNISLPLTPPASEQRQPSAASSDALEILKDLQNDHSEVSNDGQKTIALPPDQYQHMLTALERDKLLKGYVDDKARCVCHPSLISIS